MSKEAGKALSTKKEQLETLEAKNTVRVFLSAAVMGILIPIFILIIHFSGMYGEFSKNIKIYMAVCEVLQIAFAAFGYFIVARKEADRRNFYCCSYFMLTAVCMSVTAGLDMKNTGSWLFYFLTAAYAALVPVMAAGMRRIFLGIVAAGITVSVAVSNPSARNIVDVLIVGVAAFAVGELVQNYIAEHVRTEISLRDKTITADKDPLTGLMNRRGLAKSASVLWPYCARTATSVGIIEIDIDFFKRYNDRFGHPAGDKCLKQIAKTVKQCANRNSDITARTGGEEFLIFVQGMGEEEITEFAIKIRNAVNELKIAHAYAGVSKYVTVSMGIAVTVPDALNSFDALYEESDKALYAAKENGRNCIVFGNKIYGRMKKGVATMIS